MIKPLTSFRFFFALMIFTYHINSIILNPKFNSSDLLKWIYNHIFNKGFIGVGFFFVLSGFILAYNYQSSLLNRTKSIYSFLKARIIRIYPLHILTFIISFPLSISLFNNNPGKWLKAFFAQITLTQSFFPDIIYSFNSPSWSISNEMFFYFCFPFLIFLIGGKSSAIKMLKYMVISFFLLLTPITILFTPNAFTKYIDSFYNFPIYRISDFILGILTFNAYKLLISNKKFLSLNFNYLEITTIGIFLIFLSFHSYIPRSFLNAIYYWIPMSLLILIFSFQKGYISHLLSKKYLILLGEISFGFYLIHMIVLQYCMIFIHYFNIIDYIADFPFLYIVFTFSLAITLSYFSYIKFEVPVNKYLKKKLNPKITKADF